MNQKHSTLAIFVVLWAFTVVLYLLQATGSVTDWIQTCFYVITSCVCFVALLFIKSDESLWQNLNPLYLILSVIIGLVMTTISWGLSLKLGESLLSVGYTMTFIASPSSVSTIFLSIALYGLVMAATAEELMKLAGFAELKERFSKYPNGRTRWYGVFIYVGVPVGFWAILHGISAYDNLWAIVPAFINGIVLIVFLWKTKCIFACILSHFFYNFGITAISFANGTAPVAYGTPLFPDIFKLTIADISVLFIAIMWIGLFVGMSLRNKNY